MAAGEHRPGSYTHGQVQRQQLGAATQYYLPQGRHWLFFAAPRQADVLTNPDVNDTLLLGGDNGLRGYPLRYQSGTRRALFTVEERFYTDIYLWRLFRIGGAAFSTWVAPGAATTSTPSTPAGSATWASACASSPRARRPAASCTSTSPFPLNATPDIAKVQFLVKTKTTF